MSSSESAAPAAGGEASASPASFTIILFYMYTRVAEPKETLAWQEALCKRLNLKGRIRIATEGINGTLAGSAADIAAYIADMNDASQPHRGIFAGIEYKYSTDSQQPFPALGMFEVKELTASGAMAKSCKLLLERGQPKLTNVSKEGDASAAGAASEPLDANAAAAAANKPIDRNLHLTPKEWHAALESFNPETDLLLDTRNAYETAIGLFDKAVDPKLRSFAQLPEYITQNLDVIKQKKRILMYCTGGIRCEKASLYMSHRTGAEVKQLAGGIHKYLDEYPDGGFFRGKNFVFDGRLAMASTDPTVIGTCVHCKATEDRLSESLLCRVCKTFVIICPECTRVYQQNGWQIYCAEHILLAAGKDYQPPQAVAAPEPTAAGKAESAVAVADSEEAARPEDSWSPPSSDPGCPEQLLSFLSRFTVSELEAQLDEMHRILLFFKTKQKKAGSRSANRKANLHTQIRRLEEHITARRRAEAEAKGETFVEPPQLKKFKSQKEPRGPSAAGEADSSSTAAPQQPQQLISFVPFLNV